MTRLQQEGIQLKQQADDSDRKARNLEYELKEAKHKRTLDLITRGVGLFGFLICLIAFVTLFFSGIQPNIHAVGTLTGVLISACVLIYGNWRGRRANSSEAKPSDEEES